jgi:predicted enzyme related to lactoylglutathione lyase
MPKLMINIDVDDVENALVRAVSAGARAESPVEAYPWGQMAVLSDPFGNGFCLIALAGAGYSEIATPYSEKVVRG